MGNVINRHEVDEDDGDHSDSDKPPYLYYLKNLQAQNNTKNTRLKCGKKRKHSNGEENNEEETTKCFKLDTPKYVYQKLFVEGCDSDVVICALGKRWRLHRVYLEQCDYFRALFCGNWSDSFVSEYNLEILDKNITYDGLNNVFASLYNNEIEINDEHIASVTAAASMLNLTSVLDQCSDILSDYLSEDKILLNLTLSDMYGFVDNVNEALKFLKFSFWRYCLKISFLKELEHKWLVKILSSDTLCVKENEMDLYVAIKNWIYLQNFPEEEHLNEEKMIEFFNSSSYDCNKYKDILCHIRVSQITLLLNTTKMIKRDGLIPKEIIDWVMRDQWNTLLINEEATSPLDEIIDDDFFYRHCFRLGRNECYGYRKTMWRWLGCFFGTDLLINYFNGVIRFVRNCTNIPAPQRISVKMCEKIRIHYRVFVCHEDDGEVLFDSKHCNAVLEVDGSIKIGSFSVPKRNFSVHVFYLASIPGPSSTFYWDNFVQKQISKH